jgi:hypothetical protein
VCTWGVCTWGACTWSNEINVPLKRRIAICSDFYFLDFLVTLAAEKSKRRKSVLSRVL